MATLSDEHARDTLDDVPDALPRRSSVAAWIRRRRDRDISATLLFSGVTLVVLLLVVPPMVFLVLASVTDWVFLERAGWTWAHFEGILSSNLTLNLAKNTLAYSAGSTGLALAMGAYFAWIVGRTDGQFKKFIYAALFVSFAIPGLITTIGWILLLGPRAGLLNTLAFRAGLEGGILNIFTLQGMILAEGTSWVPVAFLLLLVPLSSMDPSLEEAGQMSGMNTWQVIRRITLPLALPSVLAALILSFIRALEAFETPALLGIPSGIRVFTTEIYLELTRGILPNYGSSSAYAVVLMVIVTVLLWFYTRSTAQTKRFSTITGKGFRPQTLQLGRARKPLGVLTLVLLALQFIPVFAVLYASFLPYYQAPTMDVFGQMTFDNYRVIADNSLIARAIVNTLIVAVAASTGVSIITLLAAWLLTRSRIRLAKGLDFLVSLPIVIPGIVIGVAVLRTYISLPLPIYGTLLILVFGYWLKYIPYSMRYSHAGMLQIHPELEESAETAGFGIFQRLRRIVLPLALPALMAGFLYVFLIASREFTIALLLYSPRREVISVAIFDLYQNGQFPEMAAFAMVVSVGFVAIAAVLMVFVRKRGLQV